MARLIPCSRGHSYDADLYSECPWCRKEGGKSSILKNAPTFQYEAPGSGFSEDSKTVAKDPGEDIFLNSASRKSQDKGMSSPAGGKTIGFWAEPSGNDLVTGWLVVVKGSLKGRFYPIYYEKNYLGRSHDMDIIINGDPFVSEKKHCSITYDVKYTNRFYAVPGNGETLLNDSLLEKPTEIRSGDRLSLGNSVYEFVPFCREGHAWGKGDL